MTNIKEMRELVKDGTAKILTVEAAKSLIGKKIQTIYFGYSGQDGVDEFIVGNISNALELAEKSPIEGYNNRADYWKSYMTEKELEQYATKLVLLDATGNDHSINCHSKYDNFFTELTFTCSDADRPVYYVIAQ